MRLSRWVLAVVSLFLLAGCGSSLENSDTPAAPAEERIAEFFMPDAEGVVVEENFSKDPQYDTVAEAFEARDQGVQTQGVMGSDKVQIRTHTFSNGEKYTYTVYNGIVFDGDVIEGTTKELQEAIATYETQLAEGSDAITTQGAMYDPFCASRFLFICGERRGGGWPGGILYVDTNSLNIFTRNQRDDIIAALNEIDARTQVTVKYRTTDYRVKFTNNSDGCYAVPGRSSKQPQILNLADSCFRTKFRTGTISDVGTIVHEIGHSLGLMHEHQRTDRDSFIVVNRSNLTSKGLDAMKPKYDHESRTTYDYASIMHYPRTTGDDTFVKSTREPLLTIVGSYTGVVGGSVLTARDIQAINTRY